MTLRNLVGRSLEAVESGRQVLQRLMVAVRNIKDVANIPGPRKGIGELFIRYQIYLYEDV